MATFTGTNNPDTANATTGTLIGFTGGTVAELQDAIGDTFNGLGGIDTIIAGSGDDTVVAGAVSETDGAWLVAELTVTATEAEVLVAPPLSRATAVSW